MKIELVDQWIDECAGARYGEGGTIVSANGFLIDPDDVVALAEEVQATRERCCAGCARWELDGSEGYEFSGQCNADPTGYMTSTVTPYDWVCGDFKEKGAV